jgi:hypothetical protein
VIGPAHRGGLSVLGLSRLQVWFVLSATHAGLRMPPHAPRSVARSPAVRGLSRRHAGEERATPSPFLPWVVGDVDKALGCCTPTLIPREPRRAVGAFKA